MSQAQGIVWHMRPAQVSTRRLIAENHRKSGVRAAGHLARPDATVWRDL
nr:hypothetical protein [Gammaproteobacteria bacterium]